MLITFTDLEKDASQWTSNISPSVNPKQSLLFQASSLADGRLLVSNAGNVPYAGGLVSRKLQIPQVTGNPTLLQYAQFSAFVTLVKGARSNVARLEFDGIFVFKPGASVIDPTKYIRNKKNCSTQLNLETGLFEIDASSTTATWYSIGGGPGKTGVSYVDEHYVMINCAFDHVNDKHSVLSISWDNNKYGVPLNLQNIVDQPSNWGDSTNTPLASIQKQNEMLQPGTTEVIYRATTLALSDNPF